MDWWNVSVFGITPVVSVLLVFFVKRKFLWTAPLLSTVLSIAISVLAMPSILSDNMFWGISIPIHLAIVIILTATAYLVAYILKRKQK